MLMEIKKNLISLECGIFGSKHGIIYLVHEKDGYWLKECNYL
jgi:hypothetical protein